jgi:hypothetical protein
MKIIDELPDEKDQIINHEGKSSDNSYLSIANFAKKGIARLNIFYVWFSAMMFLFALYYLWEDNRRVFSIVSNSEKRMSFTMFCIVFVALIQRLKWCYDKKRKIYIHILTVTCLIWLIFNVIFYFSSEPHFILLFSILVFSGIFLHPSLPELYRTQCLHFLRKILRPLRAVMTWLGNRKGFVSKILKISISILSASRNAFERIKLYYSNDETIFLLYIVFVSYICLFTILDVIIVAVLIMLFFVVNVRIIKDFKLPARFKRNAQQCRSARNPTPVSNYFSACILHPLVLFQSVGSVACFFVFVFSYKFKKLPLSFQLTMWSVCLWNLAMGEIRLFARIFVEELRIRYRENYDDVSQK